jgi:D-alanyl-D-alanine carboxypeptidase
MFYKAGIVFIYLSVITQVFMNVKNFTAQMCPANRDTGWIKAQTVSPFRLIIILLLIVSLNGCKHRNTHWKTDQGWESLIARERAEPGSVIQVDNAVIAYMKKYHVPGLSIAIAKDDKLIYVKAYGYADVTTQEKVTTKSLFRLASVSKPVTSIAIMKLVQEGSLSLDSKVFGDHGILGNDYGPLPDGSGVKNITIDELLHHTSGWSRSEDDPTRDDPTFNHPSLNAAQLITWTLVHQPLTTKPGTAYAYSNFNFFLLGRVIEKVTGQRYQDYVNANILHPAGITDMQIGGNSKAARKPNEVVYYEEGDEPYQINLSRMDSGCGWIASASDLLRLMVSTDGLNLKKPILDSAMVKKMLTPSKVNPGYACGWFLTANGKATNWYHTGEIMGTATLLAHTQIGFSWAILTNTGYQNAQTYGDLDQILWKAINNPATRWPEKDLF